MPSLTRFSDLGSGHPPCFAPTQSVEGSSNVFCNNLPVMSVGDAFEEHCCTPDPEGGVVCCTPYSKGQSPNVFINGKSACRLGDPCDDGQTIVTGSNNVFVNG